MQIQELVTQLQEVSMSPGSLKAFAATPEAQKFLVGWEAEMAIPTQDTFDDEPSIEPDWGMDRPARDFEQIKNFFTDGEYGLSRREANELEENILNDFEVWIEELAKEAFDDRGDRTITQLAEEEGLSEAEIEELLSERSGGLYEDLFDRAMDQIRDDVQSEATLREFLEYDNIDTMRRLSERYHVSWPYTIETRSSDAAGAIRDLASEIGEELGVDVLASTTYHGAPRTPKVWLLEPDSSINTPDDTYAGLELITPSPPPTLPESLAYLDRLASWASRVGAETNSSTGFHVSVSHPDFDINQVDWVKLVLFLGDSFVLNQFGRLASTYAKSSLASLSQHVADQESYPISQAVDAMRKGMMQLAATHLNRPKQDKYVSVNMKPKYVEFRSAGGDWLDNVDQIKLTMLRYVRAMSIAADPSANKQEYARKLYQIMRTGTDTATNRSIQLFGMYNAGLINRSDLAQQIKSLRNP